MNNPLRHPEQINPKIAADVQAALEKNRAAGRVVDGDFADSVASSSLADVVKADTDEVKETRGLADSWLEQIANPEIKRSFETAFAGAEQLFARISLTTPTPEEFTAAGVDFARLEREFERMEQAGLEPALVISPAIPLEKDSALNLDWQLVYDFVTSDNTIPNNPLKKRTVGNGLYIVEDVQKNAGTLYKQELDRISSNPNIHHVRMTTHDQPDLPWTVAILPTTDKPQELRAPHALHNLSNLATISQYLTLQATRIQAGLQPVDKDTHSWLQGRFNYGSQAPCGSWGSGYGHVYVRWYLVGYQSGHLGVRLPVWG